jgi:hypothetical protein
MAEYGEEKKIANLSPPPPVSSRLKDSYNCNKEIC